MQIICLAEPEGHRQLGVVGEPDWVDCRLHLRSTTCCGSNSRSSEEQSPGCTPKILESFHTLPSQKLSFSQPSTPPLSSPPSSHRGRPQAQAVIGPFELDPITRMSLENIVSSGASRFPVRHFRDQNDPHPWLGRRVSVSVDWGRECWWVEGVHGI